MHLIWHTLKDVIKLCISMYSVEARDIIGGADRRSVNRVKPKDFISFMHHVMKMLKMVYRIYIHTYLFIWLMHVSYHFWKFLNA